MLRILCAGKLIFPKTLSLKESQGGACDTGQVFSRTCICEDGQGVFKKRWCYLNCRGKGGNEAKGNENCYCDNCDQHCHRGTLRERWRGYGPAAAEAQGSQGRHHPRLQVVRVRSACFACCSALPDFERWLFALQAQKSTWSWRKPSWSKVLQICDPLRE